MANHIVTGAHSVPRIPPGFRPGLTEFISLISGRPAPLGCLNQRREQRSHGSPARETYPGATQTRRQKQRKACKWPQTTRPAPAQIEAQSIAVHVSRTPLRSSNTAQTTTPSPNQRHGGHHDTTDPTRPSGMQASPGATL